jgi:hypothetical protein
VLLEKELIVGASCLMSREQLSDLVGGADLVFSGMI